MCSNKFNYIRIELAARSLYKIAHSIPLQKKRSIISAIGPRAVLAENTGKSVAVFKTGDNQELG